MDFASIPQEIREESLTQEETEKDKGNDVIDMTEKYRDIKNPVGDVVKPDGYSESKHKEEIKTAEWICQHIGGQIILLKESTLFGIKTPDYEINGLFWDLKSITSEKAADSAVRHGIKQIADKPGGVILRFCGNAPIDISLVKEKISNRLRRSKSFEMTVLLIHDGKLLLAMQSKK